jgi:uncharacterized MAPEG superfamily protein
VDIRKEERRIRWRVLAALLFCAAILAASRIVLPALFDFPEALPERLAFGVQASLFAFLWPLAGVAMVAHGRRKSEADIRGSAYSPPSEAIAVQAAFLQNSFEQSVLAAGAWIALATLLSGADLGMIVGAALLFAVGRIAFLAGYPKGAAGRAFGMATTMIPSLLGYILALVLIVAKI